jgi:hypothetical protein
MHQRLKKSASDYPNDRQHNGLKDIALDWKVHQVSILLVTSPAPIPRVRKVDLET